MNRLLSSTAAVALLCAGAALAAEPKKPANPAKPAAPATTSTAAAPAAPASGAASNMTDDQKAIYALGFALWRNLQSFELTADEVDLVTRGMNDAAHGAPAVITLDEARPMIDALRKGRMETKLAAEKEAGAAYLAKAAAEPGAVKSESGMIYRETAAGTGASPAPTDTVKVNYRGTLTDGTEFDSSSKRGQPAEFALNRVVKCWTEGIGKMKVGGKATFVCPSDLAYGDRGRPSIPPGAVLLFEVELLEIVQKSTPAETPHPTSEGDQHPQL
jgi:FKBP-type peptidyl-prolyl cis-trans isomerase FkpA